MVYNPGGRTQPWRKYEHGTLSSDPSVDPVPLSVLFDRYATERRLPEKTKADSLRILNRFSKILGGDRAAHEITQGDVRAWKASLLSSPGRQPGTTMGPASVAKNLATLRAVLTWAKNEGLIQSNPAEGIKSIAKHKDGEERMPLDAEHLRKIFAVQREGTASSKTGLANFWLPWLALYTGARLQELGQLRVCDVRTEDGVDYLDVKPGDGRRLKTKNSKRRVPIHPEVLKLCGPAGRGFLDYVRAQLPASLRERTSGLLFPELNGDTATWSAWWSRHLRKACGITDRRLVFHSFRHTFKDAARAVMPEDQHDVITGHGNGSVGRSYGRGVPLKLLAESMAKVRFNLG